MREFSRLVFVHIPKTGGTTLTVIFKSFFGKRNVLEDRTYRKDRLLETTVISHRTEALYPRHFDSNRHRCVIGHFSINKYEHLNWPMITFMRNPVDRVCSGYSIWRVLKQWGDYEDPPEPTLNLYAYLQQNVAYRMLGKGKTLLRLSFIGLTERYEESLLILEKMLNKELPLKGIHSNMTPQKKKFKPTKEQYEYLARINHLDMALYEKAQNIFDQQVKEYL